MSGIKHSTKPPFFHIYIYIHTYVYINRYIYTHIYIHTHRLKHLMLNNAVSRDVE